jgi:hypothetical protein
MYKHYVEGAPPEPRPERFLAIDRRDFGSLLHDGANMMINAVVDGKPWPDADDVTRACLNMVEVDAKSGDKTRPYFHLSAHSAEISRRLHLFRNRFRMWGVDDEDERDALIRDHCLVREEEFAVDGEGKQCPFEIKDGCPKDAWRGRVDYAESHGDHVIVIDFKNRPAIFKDSEILLDEQLSGYIDLLLTHFPQFKKLTVGIFYFEFGYEQLVEIDIEQVEENVRRLHRRAADKEALTKEQIGPEPGFGKCQYCDYIASCRAGAELVHGGHLAPTDGDQARKLGEWLVVTEEKVKAAKEGLKLYTAEFGPVVLDDKTAIGFSVPKVGSNYDKNLALRIIKQMIVEGHLKGEKLSDYTKVDTEKLKKAAKRQVVDEALEPARKPKTDSKFKTFRTHSEEGVRAVKKGRAMVTHPDDEKKITHRQTKAKIKGGGE